MKRRVVACDLNTSSQSSPSKLKMPLLRKSKHDFLRIKLAELYSHSHLMMLATEEETHPKSHKDGIVAAQNKSRKASGSSLICILG
ncbi:hypothetical protein AAC387_Pa02g1834 [Persea americana]